MSLQLKKTPPRNEKHSLIQLKTSHQWYDGLDIDEDISRCKGL